MRSNFFLSTNFVASFFTLLLTFLAVIMPEQDQTIIMGLLACFFVLPAVVGWISFAFKKRIGALVCAFMFLYYIILFFFLTIIYGVEAISFATFAWIMFPMYLASYFKQKALDAQDDF